MAKKNFQYETIQDFASKMDWEGGLYNFALYGCEPSEIKDKKLRALWKEFMIHHKKAEEVADKIYEFLE